MTQYSVETLLDMVEEMDSMGAEVTDKEADFIDSLLLYTPVSLSPRQRDWILDMHRRYLGPTE